MMSAVYVINIFKKQSVLKSILVTYYMFYLIWSGLVSNPEKPCNDFAESHTSKIIQIILHNIGYVFMFVSLSMKISINEKIAEK
jgi:hypothetical protein